MAILDGRPVPSKHPCEVLEVRNAAAAYDRASKFKPWSTKDFLSAHKIINSQLVNHGRKFRSGQVGVWQDGKVRHMAPPAKRVPTLIDDLLENLAKANDMPLPIRAAIVHYEIEFIHPFSDGNGRMGRLWQHVVLLQESPAFEYCPFESVIYARQSAYYKALRAADRLELLPDGKVKLKLKTPWHDGTSHLVLTPSEFLEKLAAIVPPLSSLRGPDLARQAADPGWD